MPKDSDAECSTDQPAKITYGLSTPPPVTTANSSRCLAAQRAADRPSRKTPPYSSPQKLPSRVAPPPLEQGKAHLSKLKTTPQTDIKLLDGSLSLVHPPLPLSAPRRGLLLLPLWLFFVRDPHSIHIRPSVRPSLSTVHRSELHPTNLRSSDDPFLFSANGADLIASNHIRSAVCVSDDKRFT